MSADSQNAPNGENCSGLKADPVGQSFSLTYSSAVSRTIDVALDSDIHIYAAYTVSCTGLHYGSGSSGFVCWFSRVRGFGNNRFEESLHMSFKVEMSSSSPVPLLRPGSRTQRHRHTHTHNAHTHTHLRSHARTRARTRTHTHTEWFSKLRRLWTSVP